MPPTTPHVGSEASARDAAATRPDQVMNATRLEKPAAQPARLLLAEHDRVFGAELSRALGRDGFTTDWVQWGCDLGPALRQARYECVLLDLELPDLAGEAALQAVRQVDPGQSVIVVSAQAGLMDRIRLLDLGADDHLTKPIDAAEVAARVRAVTRRTQRAQAAAVVLAHGPLCLQIDRRSATWHGREVPLTNMEYWLLETLVRRKQQVLSRAVLEEMLYGWGDETSSNTVEVYVHYLRRKFHRQLVRTVRGVGYQIGPEEALAG